MTEDSSPQLFQHCSLTHCYASVWRKTWVSPTHSQNHFCFHLQFREFTKALCLLERVTHRGSDPPCPVGLPPPKHHFIKISRWCWISKTLWPWRPCWSSEWMLVSDSRTSAAPQVSSMAWKSSGPSWSIQRWRTSPSTQNCRSISASSGTWRTSGWWWERVFRFFVCSVLDHQVKFLRDDLYFQPPMGDEGGRRRRPSTGEDGRRRRHPSNTTSKPAQANKSSTTQPAAAQPATTQTTPNDDAQKKAAAPPAHRKKADGKAGKKESTTPNKWIGEARGECVNRRKGRGSGLLPPFGMKTDWAWLIWLFSSVHFIFKADSSYRLQTQMLPAFGLVSQMPNCRSAVMADPALWQRAPPCPDSTYCIVWCALIFFSAKNVLLEVFLFISLGLNLWRQAGLLACTLSVLMVTIRLEAAVLEEPASLQSLLSLSAMINHHVWMKTWRNPV